MPDGPKHSLNFFVYVVESPSAPDLYHQRFEAGLLQQAVHLNQIPCVSRCAISAEAFEAALRVGLPEAMTVLPQQIPILHISCHGSSEGIEFSNLEKLSWANLRQLLRPINVALSNGLLVCMSACEGYAGSRMAMHLEDADYPFLALVGNAGRPTWSETAVAFATFYHLLSKGEFIPSAVEAMRTASGNRDFFLTTAMDARSGYREHIGRINAQRAQQRLFEQARQQPEHQHQKQVNLEKDKM